jgi:hypothetical protein
MSSLGCNTILERDSTESSLSDSAEDMSIGSLPPEKLGAIEQDVPPGDESPGHGSADELGSRSPDLRAYQQEMLEESMKGNVIVSVSTGWSPSWQIVFDSARWKREAGRQECEGFHQAQYLL